MGKPDFAYAKTKAQINCTVTAQLISAFVFATQIVQDFAYAKTKAQINCTVTAQLISAFVFATQIVKSLYFLNPK